ncbi:MAG TPA: AarF/UbiB family protein, partial [Gemmatimonadaceae bacterium]|nr:AarF/UbiB family protein [Gemmatimonadaceae bacterium]
EVPPLPAAAIADVIEEDLGARPDQLFASFDPKPLGSASIGQVHGARLRDGREVVLKVRKPGVDELVPVDRDAITRDIDRMLELYVDVSLDYLRFGDAMTELYHVVREHDLRVPGTLVQFFKALAMCEGILRTVDPDSSFADYLQPLTRKLVMQTVAGPQLLGRLRDSAADAAELGIELPRRVDHLLGEVERGDLRVWTRVEDIDPILQRIEHMVARSNATILAAACIVGLAVVMLYYRPEGWRGWIGAVFWIAVGAALIDYVRTLLTLRKR